MSLYRVVSAERKLKPFVASDLGSHYREQDLEDWIEANPQVLLEDEPVLIIGRQVNTPVGVADLLAVDSAGAGVVIELKRLPSQREVISQALEYVTWLAAIGPTELRQIAEAYLAKSPQPQSFNAAWQNTFGTDPTEIALNSQQRVFVVIEGRDDRLKAVAQFLRTSGVDISLLTYSFYETDTREEMLAIELEVGPEEDAPTAESKPSEARLLSVWDAKATESYTTFRDVMLANGLFLRPMKSGISFLKQTQEGPVFVCFFNAHKSTLLVWLRSDSLSLRIPFAEVAKAMRSKLPAEAIVKHTNVWFIVSFPASPANSSKIAELLLAHVVAALDKRAAA